MLFKCDKDLSNVEYIVYIRKDGTKESFGFHKTKVSKDS